MRLFGLPALHDVTDVQFRVADAFVLQLAHCFFVQISKNFDADDVLGEIGQARRDEPASGTDFQNAFVLRDFERLQHAGFDLWSHHDLVAIQRHRDIGECQFAITHRDEVFPLHVLQQGKHAVVQHFPGANLLFHHVETRLFEIHIHVLAPGLETSQYNPPSLSV